MSLHDSMGYILQNAEDAFSKIDYNSVEAALGYIIYAKKVFAYGAGRSGLMIRAFAIRLGHLGIPTYVISETITPSVNAQDAVVLISGSGETNSVIGTAYIANKIGAKLIAIIGKPYSRLAQLADTTITLSSNNDGKSKYLAPLGTLFETSALIFLDALIAELMKRTNQTEDDMSARHATLE